MAKHSFHPLTRYLITLFAGAAIVVTLLYMVYQSLVITFPPVDRFIPEVTGIAGYELKEISNDSLKLECTVRFYNPNPVDITISNILFDVLRDGVTLGVITRDSNAVFKANDTVSVVFQLKFITEKMVGIFTNQPDTLHIVMKGPVYAEVLGGKIDRSVEFPFSIAIKDQMNDLVMKDSEYGNLVKIQDPRFEGFSFKKTTITIPFTVNNPYNLDLTIVNYPAQIFINDKFIGNGRMPQPLKLAPNQKGKTGSFLFDADNASTLGTLPGILFGGKLKYATRGTIKVKVFDYIISIPFNHNGRFL